MSRPSPLSTRRITKKSVAAPTTSYPYVVVPRSGSSSQIIIGVVVLVGAALAIIGCLMPWVDLHVAGMRGNGFDFGYLTDWSNGDGRDGIVILFASLAAAGLAIPHFVAKDASPIVVGETDISDICDNFILLLGIGIGALAGFDLGRLIKDLSDICDNATSFSSYCHPMDIVGPGLYITVAGGVVLTASAIAGIVTRGSQERGARSPACANAGSTTSAETGSCALCGKSGLSANEIRVLRDGSWVCEDCTAQAAQ